VPKKGIDNKKQGRTETPKKTGFGDKKLEGPNRPAE
jgi:hypothetical protein